MCSQKVRGSEVMRLLGNKANLYNRQKKNRLCGFCCLCGEEKTKTVFRVFRVYRVDEKCP